MFAQLVNRIARSLTTTSTRRRLVSLSIFGVFFLPMVGLSAFTYLAARDNFTTLIMSRRLSIATLAAQRLEVQFAGLEDIGVSLASRVRFRELVAQGNWQEAVTILDSVPRDFPDIERTFLADPAGTLMADTPALPNVRGKNFATRDWYKGVSANWEPYVSEIYKRTAEPQYNVIAIAVPIKANDQKVLGILVLQIRLDTLVSWTSTIEVGSGGFLYFVDPKGHVAGHPKFPPQGEIGDFSSVPNVQDVLAGKDGVGLFFNPVEQEDRLAAFAPVPRFGWGAIVTQPAAIFFVERADLMRTVLAVVSLTTLVTALIAYLLLRLLQVIVTAREQEKLLLASIGDGVVAIDRSFTITSFNREAATLTGWNEEEVVGKPFRDIVKFVREENRTENITFIEEAMLFGEVRPMEPGTLLVRRDGTTLPVGDSASPVFGPSRSVVGAIIVFRDISKEREVEKVREEFSSLAAHQLRAPATAIKGFASLLLAGTAGKLGTKQRAHISDIAAANDRMLSLVNALLNVSRIELGTLAIEPEATDVAEVADAVVKELLPQAQGKKIKILTEFGKDLPVIQADPKLLRVIIQNLLTNSVKYTPPGGTITLSLEREDPNLVLKVADTGYGIPQEARGKIFTKLFRADNIVEKEPDGTGLGLYVVKAVVEQAGGTISFTSEENKGTTFTVTLPLSGMKRKEGTKGLT